MGSILVAIMAGGKGRRAGGNKQAMELAGSSLLDHALRKARGYSRDPVIVTRADRPLKLPDGCTILHDSDTIMGPLAGLAAALNFAIDNGHEHVLALACDTPFLPDDLADRLSAAIQGKMAALAQSGERLQPLCSLWHVKALDHLDGYLDGANRSVIGFAEHIGYEAVSWDIEQLDPFFNINDQDDLARAEKMFMLHVRRQSD